MIARRRLLIALCLGTVVAPLVCLAQQQGKVWRIGFLYFGSRRSALDSGRYAAFIDGMRDLGYVEGKHFVVEARYAEGSAARAPELAEALVGLNVDVIVATGDAVYGALQKATGTIPIVATVGLDAFRGAGANLARPGGNITGTSPISAELSPKRIELLVTAMPKLSRLAVLMNPSTLNHPAQLRNVTEAAHKFGIEVRPVNAGTPEEIERGFALMARQRAPAVLVFTDTFYVQQARQIAELALKHRLPTMFGSEEYVDSGGLMSYGPDIRDNFRRAAVFVDKILKGAKPGDLPIEQPTRIYLVINRKTANALGFAIPQELLLRADKVIE